MARNFHPERTDPRGLQKNQRALEELLHQLFDRADGEELFVVLAGRAGGQTILQGVTLEGGVTLNDLGEDVDFRVESDTEPNALFVDGANGRVGIGTAIPGTLIHGRSSVVADLDILLEHTGAQFVAVRLKNSAREWRFRNTSGGAFQLVDVTGGLVPWSADPGAPTNSFNIKGSGLAFFGSGSFGGGAGVVFLGNRTTAPSSNPSGGGIPYAEAGAYKYRGSSGTITTLAPA